VIARIHAIEERSRANGPGARFVVWLQGCTLGCAGCFNPATHGTADGDEMEVAAVVARMRAARGIDPRSAPLRVTARAGEARAIEGLTLSGGEPMQQAAVAAELLAAARSLGWSTLMFSGYTLEEIRALPHGDAALAQLDVLIDGRYVARERLGAGLRGSANQRIVRLTERYTLAEIEATPVAEIRIAPGGEVVLTGVDPLRLRR
jgi:anaerobic ribonucleoside-triphosphate reductase activating protein